MFGLASILLLSVFGVAGADSDLPRLLLETHHSDATRTRIVERAKQADFKTVAPAVLKVLCNYRPMFGYYNHVGETPWNDARLDPRRRNFVMAKVIWAHHLRGHDNPDKARVLMDLIPPGQTNPHARYLVIDAISHRQWIPKMERVLLEMLSDRSRSRDAKRHSLMVLLDRCDINQYMPFAIRHIKSADGLTKQLREYNHLTNQGNRLHALTEANRTALLETGFNLIKQLPEEKLSQGYFVALQLGWILRMKDQFKPDQGAAKYQGPSGLKKEFFSETVRNALRWHAANWHKPH